MSSQRSLFCAVLGAVLITTVLAAQELRDTIGPLERQANPITPVNPIPRQKNSVAPSYPAEGRLVGAIATVVLAVTVEEGGCVAEIRRGPEPLLTTATIPAPTETTLKSAADAFMREATTALRYWRYAQPARPPITFSVSFTFRPDAATSTEIAAAVPPPPPVPAGPRPPQPVRVGSGSIPLRLVKRVEPAYPAEALSARVEGYVIVEARTDTTGKVIDVKILRSIPLLDQAALDAVRQWVYEPAPCLNGAAVPFITTVTVLFKLP